MMEKANPIVPSQAGDLGSFLDGYVECALWSSLDNDAIEGRVDRQGENLDDNFGPDDIHPDTLGAMTADCVSFMRANAADLALYYEATGCNEGSAGHDFWLTRHHHGAGFWDRGAGEVGDRLTKAAETYGSFDLWANDDGVIQHN